LIVALSARVASHRYLSDVPHAKSRTLCASNSHVTLPPAPIVVDRPGARSASVTTCTTSGDRRASASRSRVSGVSTSAAFLSSPVAPISHPAGTVSATS
jgi:hypothetical protein